MQESTLDRVVEVKGLTLSAILIANPTSGSYTQHVRQIEETIRFLRQHGWKVELKLTQQAGDARRLAREAIKDQRDVVIAAGGDGTINEIIQELAGSEIALGVLPSGTVNVWAREVGIPLEENGARDVLVNGQMRRVDLGEVDGQLFLLMAGIGLDGEVTHAVEKKPAKRFGVLGYLLIGTWLGLGYPHFRTSLQIDGHNLKGNALQIIVGNTQLYAGAIKYTWQAKCDDGLLDVCIVRKQNIWGRIQVMLDFVLHRKERHRWVQYERCKEFKIRTHQPIAIQLDGDPKGHTAGEDFTTFRVIPNALKVLVPQHLPPELFSRIEESQTEVFQAQT